MRVVVCSDVHGNVAALEAVLADIRRTGWPDALFVAGDLALSGPRPAETLALLRSLPDAQFVQGNCDYYLGDPSDTAADVLFARQRLSADDLAFLHDLPRTLTLDAAPGRSLLVCHANPVNLEDPIKPEMHDSLIRPLLGGVTAEVVAFGHYHVPFIRRLPPWVLVDVASVGLPRDGDPRAVYAVLSWVADRWSVEHRRVTYNWNAVARDYSAVKFPNARRAAAALLEARYNW